MKKPEKTPIEKKRQLRYQQQQRQQQSHLIQLHHIFVDGSCGCRSCSGPSEHPRWKAPSTAAAAAATASSSSPIMSSSSTIPLSRHYHLPLRGFHSFTCFLYIAHRDPIAAAEAATASASDTAATLQVRRI